MNKWQSVIHNIRQELNKINGTLTRLEFTSYAIDKKSFIDIKLQVDFAIAGLKDHRELL